MLQNSGNKMDMLWNGLRTFSQVVGGQFKIINLLHNKNCPNIVTCIRFVMGLVWVHAVPAHCTSMHMN